MPDLTPEQIAAIDYPGATPFEAGMTASDFAKGHGPHGEPFRWWKGYKAPEGTPGRESNGRIYIEQTLDPEAIIWIYDTKTEVTGVEFGVAPQGSTGANVLRRYAEFARGDRVLLSGRDVIARAMIQRGAKVVAGQSNATDQLARPYVAAISAVLIDGAVISADRYRISQDAKSSGIEWLDTPPSDGNYYSVEWRYAPLFYFAGTQNRQSPRGVDGERIMQRGVLMLEIER